MPVRGPHGGGSSLLTQKSHAPPLGSALMLTGSALMLSPLGLRPAGHPPGMSDDY